MELRNSNGMSDGHWRIPSEHTSEHTSEHKFGNSSEGKYSIFFLINSFGAFKLPAEAAAAAAAAACFKKKIIKKNQALEARTPAKEEASMFMQSP